MVTTTSIRSAQADDRDAIGVLWMELLREQHAIDGRFAPSEDALSRWRNDFRSWVQSESRRLIVAVDSGDVVAFLSAERSYVPPIYRAVREMSLSELYVRPSHRRQGIGRRLVSEAQDWGREQGFERIRLVALSANADSLAFWRACGASAYLETMLMEIQPSLDSSDRGGGRSQRLGF